MLTLTEKMLKNAAATTEKKGGHYWYLQKVCARGGYVYGTDTHIMYRGKINLSRDGLIEKDVAKKGHFTFNNENVDNYPKMDRCIPNDDVLPYLVEAKQKDLLSCAEALKQFNRGQKLTYITIMVHTNGGLTFKSGTMNYTNITINCNSNNYGLNKLYTINLNPNYLVTALKGFGKNDILKIGFNQSDLRPLKISKNDDQLYIITPIKVY